MRATLATFYLVRRLGRKAQQIIPVGFRFAQHQPTFYAVLI